MYSDADYIEYFVWLTFMLQTLKLYYGDCNVFSNSAHGRLKQQNGDHWLGYSEGTHENHDELGT